VEENFACYCYVQLIEDKLGYRMLRRLPVLVICLDAQKTRNLDTRNQNNARSHCLAAGLTATALSKGGFTRYQQSFSTIAKSTTVQLPAVPLLTRHNFWMFFAGSSKSALRLWPTMFMVPVSKLFKANIITDPSFA
jgi:hypothetical protein